MKITPIKIRRINAGFETAEAAERLNISMSTFYKLEQGHKEPSVKLIARMSKLYKCTADDIFRDFKITG